MKKIFTLSILLFAFVLSFAKGNMNIGGDQYSVDTLSYLKVGPGTYYTAVHCEKGPTKLDVYYLEIDAKNPYVEFQSAYSCDSIVGTECISHIASRKSVPNRRYFAGTNADFFATAGEVGTPVYGGTVGGEIANVNEGANQALFDKDQNLYIARSYFSGSVEFGDRTLPINKVNAARGENTLVLYNHNMGNYTRTNSYGYEVLVKPLDGEVFCVNTTTEVKVLASSAKGNMRIEPGCAVLSGHGTIADFLKTLKTDDQIKIKVGLTLSLNDIQPPIMSAIGGDRIILQNGTVMDPDWVDRHPRTSIGHNADRSKVIMCVVDGRGGSAGVSTKHLAYIMKFAGATDAMNLDGGGSSGMYVEKYGIMNTPSDGKERAVGNGIFVTSNAPDDDNMSELFCKTRNISLPQNGVFTPAFLGYNKYGYLINTNVTDFTLSCDPSFGYIKDKQTFVATGSGDGIVKAVSNGIETDISLHIGGDFTMSLRLDSVINDGYYEYPLEVVSALGKEFVPMLPSAFNWTIESPEVCEIKDGILKGLKDGETNVYCKLGSFEDTLKVKVMLPKDRIMPADDFSDASSWKLTTISSIKDLRLEKSGSDVNLKYTYQSGRAPFVQMEKLLDLYSLPDTFKIAINTGSAQVSKLTLTMKNNVDRNFSPSEYNDLPLNTDYSVNIPMDKYLPNSKDIAYYPVRFQSMKFMLNAASQQAGTEYAIKIKDFSLVYGKYTLSISDPELVSSLSVYPNPVQSGESCIYLNLSEETILKAELYSLDGKLVNAMPEKNVSAGEIAIPVNGIEAGTYLLKICRNGKIDTVKIIKR